LSRPNKRQETKLAVIQELQSINDDKTEKNEYHVFSGNAVSRIRFNIGIESCTASLQCVHSMVNL